MIVYIVVRDDGNSAVAEESVDSVWTTREGGDRRVRLLLAGRRDVRPRGAHVEAIEVQSSGWLWTSTSWLAGKLRLLKVNWSNRGRR